MKFQDIIPPVFTKMMRRKKYGTSKIYNSYDAALADCSDFDGGYAADVLTRVVHEKTRMYAETLESQNTKTIDLEDLRSMLGVCLLQKDSVTVLDFGGASGAHYYIAKAFLGDTKKLSWNVVETDAMVEKARALENDELRFFISIDAAVEAVGEVDLVLSSGALQYVPDPYETVEKLCALGAEKIFITRVGLSSTGADWIFIQKSNLSWNGPGPLPKGYDDMIISYPVTMARKEKIEDILRAQYAIDLMLIEDQNAYTVGDHSFDMFGYVCSRKSE